MALFPAQKGEAGQLKIFHLRELITQNTGKDTLFLSEGQYFVARTDSLVLNLPSRIKGIGPVDSVIIMVDGPKGIILEGKPGSYFENITFRNSRASSHEFDQSEFLIIRNSDPVFKNCVFHRIESSRSGFIIRVEGNNSAPVFQHVIIRNSTVMQGQEGIIQIRGGLTTFLNCTIGFNFSPVSEGFEVAAGEIRFFHCVVAGNELTTKKRLSVFKIGKAGKVTFDNSVFLASPAETTETKIEFNGDCYSNLSRQSSAFTYLDISEPDGFWETFRSELNSEPEIRLPSDRPGAMAHQLTGNQGLNRWVLVPVFVCLGGTFITLYRKTKRKRGFPAEPVQENEPLTVICLTPSLRISVNGQEMTSRFSTDQLAFLEYLIRQSLLVKTPVNTDSAFTLLWPEESYRLEKNNRNVFLFRFRDKLRQFPGLALEVPSPKYISLFASEKVKFFS